MLMKEGIIEFQNHTYNLHAIKNGRNGCKKKSGESLESYKNLLTKDITKLQDEFRDNCNYTPNTFTYPFGAISKESKDIIKELGFKASFAASDGMNYITKDPECLYLLTRYNRVGGKSTENFFNKLLL